jgi:hypothetical protein
MTFAAVCDAVRDGDPAARLYWMALAALSTEGRYASMTPEAIHAEIEQVTDLVYS